MKDIKKIILKSVKLMNKGLSFEENISTIHINDPESKKYINACIAYNYNLYYKSLKYLLDLYHYHHKIDHNLFSYSSYGLLIDSSDIDELFLSDVFKIHSEIKDLYDKTHIELLNKSVFNYLTISKKIPDSLFRFLSSLLDKQVIQKIKENTSNNNQIEFIDFEKLRNKDVIHCYYNESSSGVGDFLRGSCYLFDLLEKQDVRFHINFSKHDISNYLKSSCSFRFKKKDIFDTEKTNKSLCIEQNYLQNIKNNIINALENSENSKVYLFTNYSNFIDNNNKYDRIVLSKACQKFMRKNLIFNSKIIQEGDKILSKLKEYSIMHFRLGDRVYMDNVKDSELLKSDINTKEYNLKLENIKKIIIEKQKEIGGKIIVMSDSNRLKEYINENCDNKEKKNIYIIHNKSQHCSNNPGNISKITINKKERASNMFYVALDMYLMSHSSSIYSYSVYPWGSGFVFWIAKIFNIQILTTQIVE